jgi:uncharacterized membrane protein YecN with MAPEG domain
MNPFYIGIPAWFVCAFVSYAIRERVIGRLSAQEIGTAALAGRADRIGFVACYVGIFVVFLVLRFGLPEQQSLWFVLFLGASAAASLYFEIKGFKSALALLPTGPARELIASRIVGLLGVLCLLGAMAATVL